MIKVELLESALECYLECIDNTALLSTIKKSKVNALLSDKMRNVV